MKLIIGLGNPGPEYEGMRHNAGFMLLDKLARLMESDFSLDKKSHSQLAKGKIGKALLLLAKPETFVNKSGEAAKKLKIANKVKMDDLIVVHDDLDIDFGRVKLSKDKDSGGHRGVQSIIDNLKSKKFWRLRIGTASSKLRSARNRPTLKAKKEEVANFVLSKFTPTEKETLNKVFKEAVARLETIL